MYFVTEQVRVLIYIEITGTKTGNQCHGSSSCSYSNSHAYTTDGSANKCCTSSRFTSVQRVDARGAFAYHNTTINALNNSNIVMRGYQAGFGGTIYCASGDQCIIDCGGNACEMLYVDCPGNCTIKLASIDTIPPITNLTDFDA
eukprot:344778_1